MGLDAMIFVFWMLSLKPTFSLSTFTFIKRLFNSSSLSAISVVSSVYLRLLVFLPAIMIPAGWQCKALTYPFSYLEPVCCSMSSSNCCFLTCIQISQEAGQVVWYSHLFQNFPQFIVNHIVKGFRKVNKAEISGILLLFRWSGRCWQFDLWFLCFF